MTVLQKLLLPVYYLDIEHTLGFGFFSLMKIIHAALSWIKFPIYELFVHILKTFCSENAKKLETMHKMKKYMENRYIKTDHLGMSYLWFYLIFLQEITCISQPKTRGRFLLYHTAFTTNLFPSPYANSSFTVRTSDLHSTIFLYEFMQ